MLLSPSNKISTYHYSLLPDSLLERCIMRNFIGTFIWKRQPYIQHHHRFKTPACFFIKKEQTDELTASRPTPSKCKHSKITEISLARARPDERKAPLSSHISPGAHWAPGEKNLEDDVEGAERTDRKTNNSRRGSVVACTLFNS